MGRLVRRYIRAYNGTVVNNLAVGNTLTVKDEDVSKAIIGASAGKKIVMGQESVTGTADVDLTSEFSAIDFVTASLAEDMSLDANGVSAEKGATAGHITLKVWKPTSSADCTPIAATVAKKVNYVVIGDPA